MTRITELSASDTLVAGDLFVVYKQRNGDARKVAASVLLDYITANSPATSPSTYTSQYASPTASGFLVVMYADAGDVHLILTPSAVLATGAIRLPPDPLDKQLTLVTSTRQITALMLDASGRAVQGAPTTLAADGFFTLKFDGVTDTWYRVG